MSTTKIVDSMRDVTVVDAAKITTGAVPAAALTNVDLVEGTKGTDIVSAGTMVIGTDGGYFDITGTTGISTMTVAAGRVFTLQFDAVVTLTHSSTLYLSGAADFTTEANDHMTFISVAANDVRQIGTGLKDGGSPVAAASVGLVSNIVEATYDLSTSAGTQDITGAGFDPLHVLTLGGVTGTAPAYIGFMDDNGVEKMIDNYHAVTANVWQEATGLCRLAVSSGNYQYCSAVYITDGIRLTWIKGGSPTGTALMKFYFMK